MRGKVSTGVIHRGEKPGACQGEHEARGLANRTGELEIENSSHLMSEMPATE